MGGMEATMMHRKPGKMFVCTGFLLIVSTLSLAQGAGLTTSFTMVEEQGRGNEIGNVMTSTSLQQLLAAEDPANIEFKILPGSYKKYFSIDKTGMLWTGSQKIDRDGLCPYTAVCTITIDVALVKPQQHFQFIKVTVAIQDINDNSPVFPTDDQGKQMLSMSENTPPGTTFVLPSAEDADGLKFGIHRYTYLTDTSEFRLVVTNNSDGILDLQLLLTGRLDREITSVYNSQIVAYDGGEPPRSGYLPLEIQILDANDNSPRFDNATYIKRVPESMEVSRTVATVHASDPDHGPNGEIVYSFSTQTSNNYGDIFGINELTGDIYLKRKLDYEEESTYNLLVTARDQGPDALMAQAKVVLHVLDINDHPPKISVTALTSNGQVEISEAANITTFVAHISVQDLDAGLSGQVRCSLQDDHFRLVELFPSEYKLETTGTFDREGEDVYRVTIHCTDKGETPLTASKEIAVTILDENDNTPEFRQATYAATLRENNTIPAPLLRVSATDRDIGDNAVVAYKLHKDAQNLVVVSPEGVISTNAVFDHEKMETFTFRVIAVDGGDVPLSATTTVTLGIIDINDEAPEFEKEAYSFGTYENQSPGTEIGTVSATDPDDPPYDEFTYSLHPDKSDIENFSVDKDSGKITTRAVLDREFKAAHYLVVVATDTRYPYPSSMVNVSIFVADMNDNAPSITFPVVRNNTVQVSSFAPKGYIFVTATAYDLDLGDNGILRFSIGKGNEDGIFDIDPTNGGISVMEDLDLVVQDWFTLTLLVKDIGSPEKSAVAVLNVQVNRTKAYASNTGMLEYGSHLYDGQDGEDEGDDSHLSYHQKIIVILAAVTAVIVAILITAIVCIKRRQVKQAKEEYRYMCRVDLAQRLSTPSPPTSMSRGARLASEPDGAGQVVGQTDSMRARKEVKFNLADGDSLNRQQDWSRDGQWTHMTLEDMQSEPGSSGVLRPPMRTSSLGGATPRQPTFKLPHHMADEKEVEMHQLLHMLKKDGADTDSTSGCSADGSNTDSGRGPSEEGDHHHHVYANHHPHLPPRIPRIPEGQEADPKLLQRPPSYNSALNYDHIATPGGSRAPVHGARTQPNIQSQPASCTGTKGCCHGEGQSGCTCSHGSQHHHHDGRHHQPKAPMRTSSLGTEGQRGAHALPGKNTNRTYLTPSNARTRSDDTSDNTSNGSSTSGSFIVDLGSDSFKAVDV